MTMATIYIENEPRQADPHQNLLQVCLSLGCDLPYFCWHPALGSVGACRQCAVKQFKDEQDTHGKLIMACMTPASDGTRISIKDSEAAVFRAGVIQGLMQNHPHDCPVCDEGGECHLQDMTVMTGHRTRTYSFGKRTFRNQYLGPFINHEMNRCIQCQRCVRFYREYAGGHDLNAFRLRDVVFFGRDQDGVLENEFSGNLIEVCPTGVFTDATLKQHYTRKWDLQMAPSICVHCALGCNITAGERYGSLRRVENRYNGQVNGYFLCDRGRFGYEFVNSPDRVREPLAGGKPGTPEEILPRLTPLMKTTGLIGIGSPRASLESNFLLRSLVGAENFFTGSSDDESRLTAAALRLLKEGPAPSPSLQDIEQSDGVLILGEDVTNTAPIMALRIRQALRQASLKMADKLRIPRWLDQAVRETAQEQRSPLFVIAPYATRLDDVAAKTVCAIPDEIARLGFAIAHAIEAEAPAAAELAGEMNELASAIAVSLLACERPVVVSGLAARSEAVLDASAQVARALIRKGRPATLAFALPETNSAGAELLGGHTLSEALDRARQHRVDTAIVLENDLYRRAPGEKIDQFFDSVEHVVCLDSLLNPTASRAEFVLPAATFAESDGTLVNSEGRAQRFFQVFIPAGCIQESWRWLRDLGLAMGKASFASLQTLDDVIAAITAELPYLAAVASAAPKRDSAGKIARQPSRYSGRTAMLANISVSEPKPPEDPDSPLAFSMESGVQSPPPPLIPFFWQPGWNSIQAVNKYQSEVGGPLRGGDPGMRLVEPSSSPAASTYISSVPAPRHGDAADLQIVPIFHIFGSEELSRHAPGVAELSPQPYVAMNPVDAALVGVKSGETVALSIADQTVTLPVVLRADLARGLAGIPAGVPPVAGLIHSLCSASTVKLASVDAAVSTRGVA
jgi:NADH-quinone oxidoreductase subunit G